MDAGTILGERYRIDHRVGEGGMGVVFRGLDLTTGKQVAIKVIRASSALEVERARRETHALTRLSHPAIVTHVADGLTDQQLPYLVMEWVAGVTAGERIEQGTGFTIRESCALVLRVAQALATAHAAGILHRDIKPSNVVMEGDDPTRAKLIDFGVARLIEAESGLTRTGIAVGTPGYMSPEQARGIKQLEPASDVFGLGCLFYECLTGRPAFVGESAAAILFKIVVVEPAPLDFVCPGIPRRLRKLVEKMLAKRVAQRIATCAEVAAELEIMALDEPPETPPPPPPQPAIHCCVLATRELPDGALDKAATEELARVEMLVVPHGATVQALGNGALLAHLSGEPVEAARRAAAVALAMQTALPGWTFVISSVNPDLGVVVEEGTALLTKAVIASVFATPAAGSAAPGTIMVHATAARHLTDFEIVKNKLVGPRG